MSQRREERFPLWLSLLKYFLHGVGFSFILSLALIAWIFIIPFTVFVLPFVTLVGLVVALIVGFALLLLVLGGLNATMTERIWHVAIDQGWGHVVLQSILLLIMFFAVGIPGVLVRPVLNFLFPTWLTELMLFAVYGFVDGYVAKRVAFIWKSNQMLDEGFRGLLTVLKYPGLIAMFAGDAVVAAPLFVMSLATKFWWVGTLVFFSLQSPIIFLIVREVMHERNKWTLPSGGWWTPSEAEKLDATISEQAVAAPIVSGKIGVKMPEQAVVAGGVSRFSVVGKVFLQGVAHFLLAILFGVLCVGLWFFLVAVGFFTFGWTGLGAFLVTGLGAFLVTVYVVAGLVVAFVVDCLVEGFINTRLTEAIWHVQIRDDWKRLLIHGLALNLAFAFASIPVLVFALSPVLMPFAVTLDEALVVIYCFTYGAISRRVAYNWETRGEELDGAKVREHERYSNLMNV